MAGGRQRERSRPSRYERRKAKAIAHVANGLLEKARSGDTTSSIFYLKTQAGWRETTHEAASTDRDEPISKISWEIVTGERRTEALPKPERVP